MCTQYHQTGVNPFEKRKKKQHQPNQIWTTSGYKKNIATWALDYQDDNKSERHNCLLQRTCSNSFFFSPTASYTPTALAPFDLLHIYTPCCCLLLLLTMTAGALFRLLGRWLDLVKVFLGFVRDPSSRYRSTRGRHLSTPLNRNRRHQTGVCASKLHPLSSSTAQHNRTARSRDRPDH